jgi:hypothetical protein
MYRPVVSLPIFTSSCLDKAFVEREIVPDAVPPTLVFTTVVREFFRDVIVDIAK